MTRTANHATNDPTRIPYVFRQADQRGSTTGDEDVAAISGSRFMAFLEIALRYDREDQDDQDEQRWRATCLAEQIYGPRLIYGDAECGQHRRPIAVESADHACYEDVDDDRCHVECVHRQSA